MSITLPQLPNFHGYDHYLISAVQLRARDLEVARLVLEGAAAWCERKRMVRGGEVFGAEIRALEVSHDH